MARIRCLCGQEMSDSAMPEIVFFTVAFQEWGALNESVSLGGKELKLPEREYWKCPKCSRLYFFESDSDIPTDIYELRDTCRHFLGDSELMNTEQSDEQSCGDKE